jgi:hypothetical protein
MMLCLSLWSCGMAGKQYGLPVTLGSSSDKVRSTLGAPTERYRPGTANDTIESIQNVPRDAETVLEWYYSSGIVGQFSRDKLSSITLFASADYKGFLPYTGTVIKGVRLTDTKQAVLDKLGKPTKVDNEPLPAGTNPDEPTVWPKESNYYWHFEEYTLKATFLDQAQLVKDDPKLVLPKDKLTSLILTK